MAEEKIEEAVKRATHELLKDPDWAANTAIVDAINANPRLARVALKTLRKRLGHNNCEVGIVALALVDMLVKNCPSTHEHVGSKDFLKTMVKLTDENRGLGIFRKLKDDENYMRLELKDRTLVLLQQWGKSFARSKSYPRFKQTYDELRKNGVRFPAPHQDETAPVFTPPKSKSPAKKSVTAKSSSAKGAGMRDAECREGMETCKVFCEMLTASNPEENLKANELVTTLLQRVKAVQSRMMLRISGGPSEALMVELLRTNDEANESVKYYEGLVNGTMQRRKPPKEEKKEPEKKKPAKLARLPSKDALAALKVKNEREDEEEKSKKKKKKKEKKKKDGKKKKKKKGKGSDEDVEDDVPVDAAASIPKLAPPKGGHRSRSRSRSQSPASDRSQPTSQGSPAKSPAKSPPQPDDLLDLFSGGAPAATPAVAAAAPASSGGGAFDLDALFGSLPSQPAAASVPAAAEEEDDDPFLALASRDD